jgi:hypothetical protein
LSRRELTNIKQEKHLYLTTVGRVTGRQHTVELWFAVSEGKIYLSHEGAPTDWMKNLCKTDQVEMTSQAEEESSRRRKFSAEENTLYIINTMVSLKLTSSMTGSRNPPLSKLAPLKKVITCSINEPPSVHVYVFTSMSS